MSEESADSRLDAYTEQLLARRIQALKTSAETNAAARQVALFDNAKAAVVRKAYRHLKPKNKGLKWISPRHYKILAAHLAGKSSEQIAEALGCTTATVQRVVRDPLAKPILAESYSHRQLEIDALTGVAVHSVREALDPAKPISTRLQGVDRFLKMKEQLGSVEHKQTAEEIVAKIFERANIIGSTVNVQINASPEGALRGSGGRDATDA